MSEKYEASRYGIFDDAITTTKTMNEDLATINDSIAEVDNSLNNESVFMGPAAEEAQTGLQSVKSRIEILTDNYNTIASLLNDTAANYKSGDTTAKQQFLSMDKDGKMKVTEGVATSDYKNSKGLDGYQLDFINKIKDGAVESYNEYGVLPSLTMAQAILESGWGKSSIGNNIFGIKAGSGWTGKTQTVGTSEWGNGGYYSITDTFRDYDSIDDSIKDHAELLTSDRYQAVINSTNYQEACKAVKDCGYATSPTYTQNLINLIEMYGLDQWDSA